MGAPLARNLATAGHDVHAWNRSREKADPLTDDGVTVHDEAAEAVAGADAVLTMLANGDAVRSVMTDEGALEAMGDGALWLQASTVGAEAAEELGRLAADRGVTYVDIPVSGTRQPAEEGKLIALASGPDDARERTEELFEPLAQKVVWLGEAGAGSRMKLVVNAWLLGLLEALSSSVALAEALGVEAQRFLEVIDGGPLFAPYAKLKGAMMIEGSFDPAFTLELAAKDAELVARAADAAGLDLPTARAVAEQLRRGVEAGHGDEDMAATIRTARGDRA
jgi:3-hydroxyisobutyrate dehydrogenase